MKEVDGGTFFEEVSDKKQETFTEGQTWSNAKKYSNESIKKKV